MRSTMINMDYDYYVHEGCLEVHISGHFQLHEAIDKFELLLDFCHDNNLDKVILDHRKLTSPPENTLLYLYEFGIEDKYRRFRQVHNRSMHFAYIHKNIPEIQHIPRLTDYSFIMRSRSFDNLQEAFKWLKMHSRENRIFSFKRPAY